MLGLGWTEMLVIGVVALIFIGPKDLPVVMGRIGKVIGQVQRMGREFQREINRTTGLDEVRNLRTSITSPLKQTADEIRKEFNAIGKDGQQQPSGALKPTNPDEESVVEAIQQQAGMAPAKKTSDQMAAEYGFTAKKAEPVKAPARTTKRPAAKTAAVDTAAPEPAAAKPVRKARVKSPAATAATPEPVKAARPRAAAAKTAAAKPTAKAPRKTAAKPADASQPAASDKPAAKPRAPRKKPAAAAGKTE